MEDDVRIGLLDLDNYYSGKWRFPNLALMKLSAYHKEAGHSIELYNESRRYDLVYTSKVFSWTPDILINAEKVVKGGVGFGLEADQPLQNQIERIYPDYKLYDIDDTAYGFLTRGCPRNCSFCNVTQHQGDHSVKVADLSEFWNGQSNIVLLDPNLTLCKQKYELMDQLIESESQVNFSQGLDIRVITSKFINRLNRVKFETVHFAWDNYEFETYEKLKTSRMHLVGDRRKYTVYVLINYNTTFDEDIDRIIKLDELGYWPYVMVYNKKCSPHISRKMQRWVNSRGIWESGISFEDYIKSFKNKPIGWDEWLSITSMKRSIGLFRRLEANNE